MVVDFAVDLITASRIDGWAWLPEQPAIPLLIEMVSDDGNVVAQTTAQDYRDDLARANKRSGWSSFFISIPPECSSGIYFIRARDGDETHGPTDWFRHEAPAPVGRSAPTIDGRLDDGMGGRGHLDEAGPHDFSGWMTSSDLF